MIGDSTRIATAVVLSRITGLARIVVAASVLGATVLGDLFVAVNVLPLTLYDIFAGSAISSVLVPPLVRHLLDHGTELGAEARARDRARRLAGIALGTIAAGMTVVAGVAMLGRSVVADALTAGVDDALAGDARAVAGLLILLIVPQIVAYAAIGVLVSVQHATRRFLLPSVAPVVENVGVLLTIGFAWWRYGSGLEVDEASTGLVVTLAIGSGLSVLAHVMVQAIGAVRALGSIRPRVALRDPELLALAEPARASLGWSSMVAARQFALVVAAAWAGAGGVQAFEMAMLVYFIPVAVVGRPIASAALPRLAGWSNDPARLLVGYRNAIRLASWLAVPAGGAMILLARPLADGIGQGRFDTPRSIELLAFALAGLGIGALGEALFEVARQTVMAVATDGGATRRRGLVASTWLRAATALVGIPAAVVLVEGPALLLVLGLVVSLGDVAALALVHRSLRRHPAWADDPEPHRIPILAAATIALAPAAAIDWLASPDWTLQRLGLLLPTVVVLFGVAAWALTDRGRGLRALAHGLRGDEPTPMPVQDPVTIDPISRWTDTTGVAGMAMPVTDAGTLGQRSIRRRFRPADLVAVYLLAMPFLAGLPRGSLVPFLRPSEMLQLAVTGIAVAIGAVALIAQRRWRVHIQPVEWWLLAVIVTSSVVPLLWLTARGRTVGLDEVLATLPFLKYGALYLLVRSVVRYRSEIDGIAKASVLAASVLAMISIAQATGVGPVIEVLERFYVSSAEDVVDGGRGTTTIGSSIATGAYLAISSGVALSLGWRSGRHRWLLVAILCTAGAMASGQAGTIVALAVLLPAVAHRHGRLAHLARLTVPLAVIGSLGLSTVLAARLAAIDQGSGLPVSWLVRWNNVSELYLPALRAGGWLLGVTPDAIVVPPDVWRTSVYLESGYLWLLWVGGVPLLVSAVGLLIAIWRSAAPERPGSAPRRSVDSVHTVVRPTVAMMAVLSLIDPHLTLRGGADLFFVLVALGSVGRPLLVPSPPAPTRWRVRLGAPGSGIDPEPASRLHLTEIPIGAGSRGWTGPQDRARPEARLALTSTGPGGGQAAVELALHRTGSRLRGVAGPISGRDTAQRALLWRSIVLVSRSLRLDELCLDDALADPAGSGSITVVSPEELRAAARLAGRLERERVVAGGRPYRVTRADGGSSDATPPVRLDPGSSIPVVKRAIDLVLGGLALVAALPLLAVVALLVRRSGPGPIVFRQVRIGAGGLPFQMAKFRTMYPDNDDAGHRAQNRREILDGADGVKDHDDPRITPIGRILRQLSLDELPQLLNVVRGEMSLVGPRPSLLWESELFPPHLRRRLTTRPGLTGLWQVSGRSDLSMAEMLELDLAYVEQRSLGLDLRCLARTAASVLARQGAR